MAALHPLRVEARLLPRHTYRRGRGGADEAIDMSREKPKCKVPICDRRAKCKGYCSGHYERSCGRTKHVKFDAAIASYAPQKGRMCRMCDRPAVTTGLCRTDYMRAYRSAGRRDG